MSENNRTRSECQFELCASDFAEGGIQNLESHRGLRIIPVFQPKLIRQERIRMGYVGQLAPCHIHLRMLCHPGGTLSILGLSYFTLVSRGKNLPVPAA